MTLSVLAATGLALAGPKGGAKGGKAGGKAGGSGSGSGSASGSDNGEIEMDGDSKPAGGAKGTTGGTAGAKGGATGGASGGATGAGSAGGDAGIEIDEDANKGPAPDLSADLAAAGNTGVGVRTGALKKTPIAWKDIVVVIRKPFLKTRRTELDPFISTTMNDNMIRHIGFGGEIAHYLTDVLAVGVEGMYYVHSFNEPFDLVARQARRLPTVNQYNWSAALDFHYVPVYGKFAVFDKNLITWESYFTAGIGVGQSEVIPRDPKYPGFTNLLIQPNVGVNMRFFLAKWLTINLGIRDYMFYDHYEPTNRPGMNMETATSSGAAAHADGAFINNIMFQVGVGFWVPTSFEYSTFR